MLVNSGQYKRPPYAYAKLEQGQFKRPGSQAYEIAMGVVVGLVMY
jgi:hypothetical protein